jgi:hypothetical protein
MAHRPHLTVHWGILLIVYLAILFATAMVELTSGTANGYLVLLLATGVPIYLITSRSIMRDEAHGPDSAGSSASLDAKVIEFPERLAADVDVARAAAEVRTHQLRKLG